MADTILAVIGGGASATLLLAHLARLPNVKTLKIDVYDREGRFARGIAYSTLEMPHLLNVRAANMSAFDDDKADFELWAGGHGYGAQDFVPRSLYGKYLDQKRQQAMQKLTVNFIRADVVSSVKTPDGRFSLEIAGHDGPCFYDQVVLASGNVRPLRVKVGVDVAGYYDDPWTADKDRLLQCGEIALIGSGLSAVDMISSLHSRGYKGQITVFSRKALFPATHAAPASYAPFVSSQPLLKPAALYALIRRAVRAARAPGVPWQAVMDSFRGTTKEIWRQGGAEERRYFMTRLFTLWNIHRHRMPPQSARMIADLQALGHLLQVRAAVTEIRPGPVLACADGCVYATEAVINCLGYRYDEPGRSYDVTARLGPARFGELFETTAIPEIRAQAADLARALAH